LHAKASTLPQQHHYKAHLAVLLANLFFGINFSVVKFISPSLVKPFGLNLIRVGVTVFLFWILYLLKPTGAKIERKDIPRFLLCAVTGVSINQLMFIKGLTLTTPIHAALLILITPVFILVIAFLLKTEGITLLKTAGLLMAVAGAAILISSKETSAIAENMLMGDILIVINAISYAFYYVLVKPLMQQYAPLHVIRWVFTFGIFLILPFCWQQFTVIEWSSFSWQQITALVFIVLGGTFFAYLFTVYGLKHLSASAAGSYIYLQPLFAAGISIVFFKEPLSFYKILAAALIFGGVYLVNKKPAK
jgi:drug/metabolite transporter (DMT)-like permease